jgi:ribose transport system substrate-binding protein
MPKVRNDGCVNGRAGRARRWLVSLVALSTVAVVAAACGGTGSTSTTTTASGSSSSTTTPASSSTTSTGPISASTLASLKAAVATDEQVPAFTAPGPAVSASVVKGTSAIVFPVNSEIDACQTQAEDFKALGASLGMNVTLFSDAGVPTQWVTGAEDAVSSHDQALVMLCGVIPGVVAPQLQAAKTAGIAVVDGNYNEVSDYAGLDGETAVDVAGGVTSDVDDALVNLNGQALHALVVTSDSIVQGPAAIAAAAAEVNRVCPGVCSVVSNLIVPIQDWATETESEVASSLVANPSINAVIVTFDGMTQFVLPAIQASHKTGLQIYTWGGSRSIEKLMESPGSIVAADSGPDEDWDAYEAMDQVIRILGHHPAAPVSAELDPNRLWVPSNVSAFFGPGGTYGNGGYGGSAFINGFRALWGLSS